MEVAVRWSPHSNGDRRRFLLLNIADSSITLNEADHVGRKKIEYHKIVKCSKLPNYTAFAWSPLQESIIALGLTSGNACLVRLSESGKQNSEPVETTFKIKHQRKCNSIAYSNQNWLAIALDRVRATESLNVYDAQNDGGSVQEPIRRLCAAEHVSSVRFFAGQPQELIASTQRSYIRIYDLRDGYLGGGGSVQASTRNVNNIAIDPLDENYFASAGSANDPSVTVWDKRWISQSPSLSTNSGAVFNFSPALEHSASDSLWSLKYSGLQRGRLAVFSRLGELRIVDMLEGPVSALQSSNYLPTNPFGGSPWHNNRYVSQIRTVAKAITDKSSGDSSRVAACDWTNDSVSGLGQAVLALYADREVAVLRVPVRNPHVELTSRQDLSVGLEQLCLAEPKPYSRSTKPGAPYEQVGAVGTAEDFGPLDYDPEASVTDLAARASIRCSLDSPVLGKILASSTVQRERCQRGYLWDYHKNVEIVAGNWQLERLWEIVNRFREQAAKDGMVHKTLDLSYVGVSGLWSGEIDGMMKRRLSPSKLAVAQAIAGLNRSKQIPAFEGQRTAYPDQRQICLAVCGWKFTTDTLEEECNELIDRGLYYQAIVQAVLHDYKHIALNLLRTLIRSKTVPNIGLGALLASDNINEEQREMCLWMAADTPDPALKALLTYLTTDNWRDVMKTNYLHLGYRVALGLKYLNDTELSGFLQSETARAIKNGDLEGILLTGLTSQAMDLFQTYITRTNDLQTAVLATAYTNPLYVDDMRWQIWKESYCDQMHSWQAFPERAKFIVQHSRLARTRDGRALVEPPPKQVTLRCNHCQSSLVTSPKAAAAGQITSTKVPNPTAAPGTICVTCGRHMPRCGICLHWLGTAGPASSEGGGNFAQLGDAMTKFLSFCVACGHGFHAGHAKEWFEKHAMCPIPDCRCSCNLR